MKSRPAFNANVSSHGRTASTTTSGACSATAATKCQTKGDKKISRSRAQELFPDAKVTHWNADALLIAEFNRRKYLRENYPNAVTQPPPTAAKERM